MHSGLNKVKASALRRWLSATKAYSRQPSHPFYGWGRLLWTSKNGICVPLRQTPNEPRKGLIFLLYFIILDARRNPTVCVNGLDVLNQHFLHWEFGLYIVRQCLHWTVDLYRRTPTCLGRLKTRFINGMVGLFSYSRI